jgi:CubicO group peptidase (beta-lactamase class C family)
MTAQARTIAEETAKARSSLIGDTLPEIDQIFSDSHLDSHAPGVVYGIVADDGFVHINGFGVQDIQSRRAVTNDSIFRIASMTKVFIGLAILSLRDEGRLSLEAPAETYVPELRSLAYPTGDSPRITVRNLLTHTAGFVTDNPWGDRQESLTADQFRELFQAGINFSRAPGLAHEYANLGYAILGQIIKNVAGEPYDRLVARLIFDPLGMTSTSFHIDDWPVERRALGYRWQNDSWSEAPDTRHGTFGAIGGILTNATDYARWLAFLLSAWPAGEARSGSIRRETVRELATGSGFPFLQKRPGKVPAEQAASYGMGLVAAHDPTLGMTLSHSGGYPGYGSHMMMLPDQGASLFIFANRSGSTGSNAVWDAALALHRKGALDPRPVQTSAPLTEAYAAVSEMYRAGTVQVANQLLANNFLMDCSAADWAIKLSKLKSEVGACRSPDSIKPDGALSGTFIWRCDHGRIKGELLLAPVNPPQIQSLRLTAMSA